MNEKRPRVYTIKNINENHKNLIKILMTGVKERREIGDLTGWCRTTIYDRLRIMEKMGIVKRMGHNNGKRGRSVVQWYLDLPDGITAESLVV